MNVGILTHTELVDIAYKWVLKNASCGFAFRELVSMSSEIPDVIGFGSGNYSVLVECKISRSDFFRDQRKIRRQGVVKGMGKYRFYCVPEYLVSVNEIPNRWGLLFVNEQKKVRSPLNPLKMPLMRRFEWEHEVDKLGERAMMYTALRRLHIRNLIDTIYQETKQ